MDKKLAVLGSPIQHSMSPVIHAAAYRMLGLDWSYDRFEVQAPELATFLASTGLGYDGFSLTMPLKDVALTVAEKLDSDSAITKSANTLLAASGSYLAFNTDVFGLEKVFSSLGVSSQRILVLGTGATARSALLAISRSFTTPEVQIWGRSSQNVNGILGFAQVIGLQATAMKKNLEFDLIVSTLPSNAYDEVSDDLSTTKLANSYFDVAYNPWPSAGSKYWNERAINHISGIHMLVWQAIAQIRIFLNGSLDVEIDSEPQLSQVMLSAAYDALK